jgi:ribosome-associated translation inhibitor RaiA
MMDESMLIQINSDNNIDMSEALVAQIESVLQSALKRFSDQITRVEVHLSDENSHKDASDDKRCVLEARLKGHQPIAVTHQAATLDLAVSGAAKKMKSSIESDLGKIRDRQRGNS